MRGPPQRALLLAVLLTMVSCRGGCRREWQGGRTARSALALFPSDTRIVASIDFRRVREAALWQKLSALVAEDPADRKLIDEFAARTGLDPFKQITGIVAAFPEDARKGGAFGLAIEGDGFDQKRLLTYARDQARLRGTEIRQSEAAGRTLWQSTAPGGPAGFFLDSRHFVLGGGGWAEKMAALADAAVADPASAESNGTLLRLIERVGVGRSIWLAALVSESTRARLLADPNAGVQASVMRLGVGLDLAPGLIGEVVAELSNPQDARALVEKVQSFVRDAKKNPQMLLLGAGPFLDGLSASADGPNARIRIALDEARTGELVSRLVGLMRLGRPPAPR